MFILDHVPKSQWQTPSQAQPKDQFGNENKTLFTITARLNDGHVVWRGWFYDRDDADAFLYAIATDTLHIQPALWQLPLPMWMPNMGEQLTYYFATTVYISNTSQTSYTTPVDWSPLNTISCLGGGGGGAGGYGYGTGGSAGGGGAWSSGSVITVGPNTTVTINIGSAGSGGPANSNASSGGDTYFNGANLAASSVGAQGGSGGITRSGSTVAGGQASNSIGSTKYSGGNGGGGSYGGGGGGGAAGPNGAGNSGTSSAAAQGGSGGSGDAGYGGAGGNGGGASQNGSPGSSGSEVGGGFGCGGGGGGGGGDGPGYGASAGSYGAGGGAGGQSTGGSLAGAGGTQGFMIITYTPGSSSGFFTLFRR